MAEVDAQAMAEMDAAPGFPNSLPTEYRLLLQRAWKQQSRDKLPLVRGLGQGSTCVPVRACVLMCPPILCHRRNCMLTPSTPPPAAHAHTCMHTHTTPQYQPPIHTLAHTSPNPQIITLMQTVVIGLVLAALFSDIPNNQVGIQDETGGWLGSRLVRGAAAGSGPGMLNWKLKGRATCEGS